MNNQELKPHHSDDDLPVPAENDDEPETPMERTTPKRRRVDPITPQVAAPPPSLATIAPVPVLPFNTLQPFYVHTMNITGVNSGAPVNNTGLRHNPRMCRKCGKTNPFCPGAARGRTACIWN